MERMLLCVFLVGISTVTAALAPLRSVIEAIPDHYIVVFKDSSDVSADSIAVSEISGVEISHEYKHAIKGLSVRLTNQEALTKIRQLKDVKYITPDGNVTLRDIAMTWGLDRVDQRRLPLDGNSNLPGTGRGVNAYIIDTGIYADHEDFGGRARVGFDACGDGHKGMDLHGHGTHCAGIVGSTHYGIAKEVNLWGVKVIGCAEWIGWSTVIAGIDWVAGNHISPAVASMSLGGWANDALDEAVRGLVASGVAVPVAVENGNDNACQYSPDREPAAVRVSATDFKDNRAFFASYGSCVDIFAPGHNVLSTFIGSPTATYTWSGTSMACPHVTGSVVLALERDPTLTPKQILEKLKAESTSGVLQNTGPLSPDRLLYIPN